MSKNLISSSVDAHTGWAPADPQADPNTPQLWKNSKTGQTMFGTMKMGGFAPVFQPYDQGTGQEETGYHANLNDAKVQKDEGLGSFLLKAIPGSLAFALGGGELGSLFGGGAADAATAGADASMPSMDLMSSAGSDAAADTAAAGAGGSGSSIWSKILGGGPNQASNVPAIIGAGGKLLSSLFGPQRQGFTGANSPENLMTQYESNSNEIGNALRERAATPITMPGANINTPRVSIPGLDVPNLGGTNISVKPYTQPGLDLSQVFGQPNPLVPKNNG